MGMRIALVVLLVVGTCRGFEKQDFDIDSDEHGQYSGSVSTNCTCGWTNKLRGRVVGGREAQVNEYPYMAGLAYTHRYGGLEVFCGATIITGHHALTAAHCTYQDDRPMAIIVGEHDLTDAYETRHTKIYKVDEKIEHELYDDDIYVYDIAILVCKTKIQFNMAVGPACLPSRPIPLEKKIVKVTGWGRLQEGGSSSPILMKANLGVIPLKECVPKYRSYNINQVAPTQFCTYAPYVDSCQGDSGGPIVWLDPDTNRYTVVGIVSFGEGCANLDTPGVNTEVSAFLGWIQKHIHRNSPTPVKTCAK